MIYKFRTLECMIIDFSIENFKSLRDKVTLSFEPEKSDRLGDYYIVEPVAGVKLLKLGIIYGPNGSGKSSILEALNFLRQLVVNPVVHKQDLLEYEPFLFDNVSHTAPTTFELNFLVEDEKYGYVVSFNKQMVIAEHLYNYTPKKALVYERKTDSEKQLATIKIGNKYKLKKSEEDSLLANTLWNATVLNSFLRTNIDSNALKDVTHWFYYVLNKLVTPASDLYHETGTRLSQSAGSKQNVLAFMQKADFGIADITVERKEEKVNNEMREVWKFLNQQLAKKMGTPGIEAPEINTLEKIDVTFRHSVRDGSANRNFSLPYNDESQGTKRYFQYSGLLNEMLTSSQVVTIDELESSLHPDLVKHFLLLFLVNSKSSQLIATTHYRELLMERDMLRDDVIWFTEKKPDGGVDLFALSDFDSSVVRDTSSVFNAYKTGKLGAVPFISDYYIELANGKNDQE